MVKFSDYSNKEKVNFLLDVLEYYSYNCSIGKNLGLCCAIKNVLWARGLECDSVEDFMGYQFWNPSFAGALCLTNSNGYWWPIEDKISRVIFLTRLIRFYYV